MSTSEILFASKASKGYVVVTVLIFALQLSLIEPMFMHA